MNFVNVAVARKGQKLDGREGFAIEADTDNPTFRQWLEENVPSGDRRWMSWAHSLWVADAHLDTFLAFARELWPTVGVVEKNGSIRYIERGGTSEQEALF
jgi:hypothetical protein